MEFGEAEEATVDGARRRGRKAGQKGYPSTCSTIKKDRAVAARIVGSGGGGGDDGGGGGQ